MRQILIEKHIEPSQIAIDGSWACHVWRDKYGDRHSVLGQPAIVTYEKKEITSQHWYKKGFLHREKKLPAYFSYKNEQIRSQYWYKNGELVKSKIN